MLSRGGRLAALGLVAGLALTGCGGGGGDSSSAGPTTGAAAETGGSSGSGGSGGGSASGGSSPTTHVRVPEGVTLTDPGTQLSFGDTARVAYEVTRPAPASSRSGKAGKAGKASKGSKGARARKTTVGTVLGLTVDSARKGRLEDLSGFDLTSDYQRKASYYYVQVTVRNLGERRFGRVDVPLWGISGQNTLLPPVRFTSAFSTCPTEQLPEGFAPGSRLRTCLVFLSPDRGTLEGVSYRPTETSTPIEWHGKVASPQRGASGHKARKGG